MDDAFRVTLGCENCGDEWDETHPPRTKVRVPTREDRVHVSNLDCTEFGGDCDCCRIARCPTCELLDPVEVVDREPIEDADEVPDEGGEAAA